MTNSAPTATSKSDAVAMRGEIAAKWGKFNETEITALKGNDELVSLVQSKYTLDKKQAQRDVDAFAKGRKL